MPNPSNYNYKAMEQVLHDHGFVNVRCAPSPIQGSPHDYTEVKVEPDGLHYWISRADELEDNNPNLLVGIANRAPADPLPIEVMTMPLAVGALCALAQLHAQDIGSNPTPRPVPMPTPEGKLDPEDGFSRKQT